MPGSPASPPLPPDPGSATAAAHPPEQPALPAERLLPVVLWAQAVGLWTWQAEGDRLHITGLQIDGEPAGLPAASLAQVLGLVDPADRPAVAAAFERHRHGDDTPIDLACRVHLGGRSVWLGLRGRAMRRGANGQALEVAGTVADITGQRLAERERRLEAQAFVATPEALVIVDQAWAIVRANPAFEALLHSAGIAPRPGLAGRHLRDLIDLAEELPEPAPWQGEALLPPADDAPTRTLEALICRVAQPAGEPPLALVALQDISQRRRAEAALERLAQDDALTGLANRQAIQQHLAARLARPAAPPFWLLFIDLDGFKVVNDSLGHDAGDALLRQAAQRLQQALPDAFIGRWGGDEFVAVLPDGADDYQLRESAQLVMASLGQPLEHEGHRSTLTASLGAAAHPADGAEGALLLRRADAAMLAAKQQGRNALAFYQPAMDEGALRRGRLQALVRQEAERHGFQFVVQPKFDVGGRSTGAELLMRWTTPEYGAVSPAEFIPIAEQIGAIQHMGRQALRTAARIGHEVRALGSPATVAVNLSPRQLLRADLERTVLHACEHHDCPPGQIELELTESALVTDIDHVRRVLVRLRRHGFQLALDDFGTGYSSLSHLRTLPFHKIKIDRSFVHDLCQAPRAQQLLDGVVRLCRSLGLSTVAEGVETEAQFALLKAMGVDEYQGYWFGRPQPQPDWLALLQRQGDAGP